MKKDTLRVKEAVADMPYFSVQGLLSLGVEKKYLRIILSRMKKRGDIVTLKKGMYVSSSYLEKIKAKGSYNSYLEFLTGVIYSPSYLTGEYVLGEHNVLSESFYGFSAVSVKKTNKIENSLGKFYYHAIKKELFCGYEAVTTGGFTVYKATLAKALFDFLYLRKGSVVSDDYLKSLRLNTEEVGKEDMEEFVGYVKKEGSEKMIKIAKFYAE